MQPQELLERVRESADASHVFGAPIQQGSVTVIPAARIRGGGGGGEGPAAKGSGAGFGLIAVPAGAFVVRGDRVRWRPAVDVNRIILGAQIVFALVGLSRLFRFLARRRR